MAGAMSATWSRSISNKGRYRASGEATRFQGREQVGADSRMAAVGLNLVARSRSSERPESGRVSDAGPARAVSAVRGPASESLRRTNPRESGEELPVYGDLAERRLCRGMILARSLRAESRVRRWIDRC